METDWEDGESGTRRAKTTARLQRRLQGRLPLPPALAGPAGIFHPFKTGLSDEH